MTAFPVFSRRNASTIRLLTMCTLVAVMLFAISDSAFAQASKKSSPASSTRTRSASTPTRVATKAPSDATKTTEPASSDRMTIERVNELTGFEPASEEEVKLLVEKMQSALSNRDRAGFRKCFDERIILARSVAGIPIPTSDFEELLLGYRSGGTWATITHQATLKTNHHGLVSIRKMQSEYRPLCRMITQEAGLVYNEYVVQKSRDDGPKIVDSFTWTGEYYSLFSRPTWVAMATSLGVNIFEIEGLAGETAQSIASIGATKAHELAGHSQAALKTLDGSPRNDSSTLLYKCHLARGRGVVEWVERSKELKKFHPEAPSTNLILLEVARITRQEADQMEIAERLMKTFDDPFLNYYRVKGLVKAGRMDEAREAMEAAKRAAPSFVDVHVADVELRLIEGDQLQTTKAIEVVESTFGGDALNLASYDGFEAFSQSAIGRAFLAKRAGFDF